MEKGSSMREWTLHADGTQETAAMETVLSPEALLVQARETPGIEVSE